MSWQSICLRCQVKSVIEYPQDDGAYPGPEQTQFPEIVTRGQHYAQIMDGNSCLLLI